jgi:HAD superfamily hydrolase (TIGR01458 family)
MATDAPKSADYALRLVLIDLDGTLYMGSRVIPGGAGAVRSLRQRGLTVRFTTNTDSVAPESVVTRLVSMGIDCAPGDVLSPVVLARHLLDGTADSRALVVASDDVRAALGVRAINSNERVTHVIVADPSYGAGYAELDRAFRALRAGAQLVAMQMGRWVRRDDGEHLDTGGWVRLLEYAAEVDALVLGKPSAEFFRLAAAAAGAEPAHTVVVGDDRASDIAGGIAAGCHTILVRTGKGDAARGPEPERTVDSIADVYDEIVNNWMPTGSR